MIPGSAHRLAPADDYSRKEIVALLVENNLPVDDLTKDKFLFALFQDDSIIGSGGLEFFSDCALLRSISVRSGLRGGGLGKFITEELENICKEKQIHFLYLLTTTAKDFFDKLGYFAIDRSVVPDAIKQSEEFRSLCPSSAIVMKKKIWLPL